MTKKILIPDAYTRATVVDVAAIVEQAERCKNAYFWTPACTAASRRWHEQQHNRDRVEWTEGGHTYAAAYHYRESCAHCYASGEYYRDGSATTLTAIRNSLRRMDAATAGEVIA